MIPRMTTRFFHLTTQYTAAQKSLLATLRKKTGYTFTNCKKALEMHDNDLIEAEKWLKQQAQTLGWSKATKLEGRQTLQGLIGVLVNANNGVLVEVNCETDFVARNKQFQEIVKQTAETCLDFTSKQQHSGLITKFDLGNDELKGLDSTDGKKLADHLALMIGNLGENATLNRAFCLKTANDINLIGYAHPSGNQSDSVQLGKFGGLLAFKTQTDGDFSKIGRDICQHIVGLNPKKIGTDTDEPAKNKDEEICLIHQEYLLDENLNVKDILEENNIEIVDFKRFECGEIVEKIDEQPLEFVETCQ